MNVNKINMNQSEPTYDIAANAYNITYEDSNVGEKLSELGQEMDDLYVDLYGDTSHEILDTTDEMVGVISGLIFHSVGGNYPNWRCVLLNVSDYKGRRLRIVPSSRTTTYIPLKDNVLVTSENVNACDGYSDTQNVRTQTDITIPVDCNYLYVRTKNVI